jgi:prepilin signal peptidase PulO-like enzyme (type II secretory pathway)
MNAEMAGEQVQAKGRPAESPAQPSPGFGELAPAYRYGAIIAALCSGASVLAHFGLGARGVISAGFVAVLAILAAIDLEHGVIPNRILVPAGCALLIAQIAFFPHQAAEWILAGLGAGLVLLIPALVKRGALGMGDVKLGTFLGVGLGKAVIGGLLLGSLAAVPFALAILVRHGTAGRKERIPLGPFLAVGGLLALLLSSSI